MNTATTVLLHSLKPSVLSSNIQRGCQKICQTQFFMKKNHFISCIPHNQRIHYPSASYWKFFLAQRSYYKVAGLTDQKTEMTTDIQMIDLRSDTITRPTRGMREAMANADVGDDVYGEDPTVNELQERCARLFGMEASLLVPTGTMGNLIASGCPSLQAKGTEVHFVPYICKKQGGINEGTMRKVVWASSDIEDSVMCHCDGRAFEAIVGHKSHILLNEQGGIAQFAGVTPRTIQNLPDGTFSLEELKSLLQPRNDVHKTWTRLICLENTHNFCGGKTLPMDFLKEVYEFATVNDVFVHTDGARVLNAAMSLGVPVSEIMKYSHSVNMCFSKGLAAPVGSILAGSKDFIAKAVRMRKALGGGMRQAGVLAAAALYSLDHIVPRLGEDHSRAKQIAHAMMKVNNGVIHIDLEGVHSNIIMVDMIKPGLTATEFCKRIAVVTEEEASTLDRRVGVKMVPIFPHTARLLTHNDLTQEMVELAIDKLQYVIKEYNRI